ncbi:TfoX/Sxy family protein [Knoellia sp. S7-12]|uniref:TfoX/Sxy family protein n=1 Tax=Knoellia sp. S7-12 TaxID=3126698 RepID=UPI0033666EBF
MAQRERRDDGPAYAAVVAYDEVLANRIRTALSDESGLTERAMFGGLGFMLDGHMAVAAGSGGSLMVRVDPDDAADLVDGEAVTYMEMGGRSLHGWLLVGSACAADDDTLGRWVQRGVAFVRALPPKQQA